MREENPHPGRREDNNRERAKIWREFVLRAWLTPMLVDSVSDACRDEAERHLEAWLEQLNPQNSEHGRAELPLSLEIALAQGFKAASNGGCVIHALPRRRASTWFARPRRCSSTPATGLLS